MIHYFYERRKSLMYVMCVLFQQEYKDVIPKEHLRSYSGWLHFTWPVQESIVVVVVDCCKERRWMDRLFAAVTKQDLKFSGLEIRFRSIDFWVSPFFSKYFGSHGMRVFWCQFYDLWVDAQIIHRKPHIFRIYFVVPVRERPVPTYVTCKDLINRGLMSIEESGNEKNSLALWLADLGRLIKLAQNGVRKNTLFSWREISQKMILWRVDLETFWSRARSTVGGLRSNINKGLRPSALIGLPGPYLPPGPLPDHDHCGYEVAFAG